LFQYKEIFHLFQNIINAAFNTLQIESKYKNLNYPAKGSQSLAVKYTELKNDHTGVILLLYGRFFFCHRLKMSLKTVFV